MATKYVTTPIYYASGHPHLGHAYTSVLADCFKRYYQLKGYDSRLTTGTDEHGLKIQSAAEKVNQSPQDFVDHLAQSFKDCLTHLNIDYDDFIRTSESRHKEIASQFWNDMNSNDDIYLGHYEGLYCVDCEQYYSESELNEEGHCPIHNTAPKKLKEESYFFKLSKYQQPLIDHIESNPEFIVPATRRNEVLSFLKNEPLTDLCISRQSFDWGIPVPNDPKHVMYVWVDALVNYISSLGGYQNECFSSFWPNTIHIIGKDILRFHAVYWPAMLMSCNLPLPKTLIVHGWWTVKNKKISKSDSTTKIDPVQLSGDLTSDALKFYLLSDLNLGRDGNLDYSDMIGIINVGLANNLGNLVNRYASMGQKYFDGQIPSAIDGPSSEADTAIEEAAFKMLKGIDDGMDKFNPADAIKAITEFGSILNTFIETTAPWQLAKSDDNKAELERFFATLGESIRWLSHVSAPFIPTIAQTIRSMFGDTSPESIPTEFVRDAKTIHHKTVLFQRITEDQENELIEKWTGEPILS